MEIKVLFLDLDGTTLTNDQVHVSERNMNAIQKAIDKGIQVVPCTGRVLDMFPPQLLNMKGIRYCITCHGARAFDRDTGRTLYESLITPEDSFKICRIIEGNGIYAEVAAQNTIFLERAVDEKLDEMPVPAHHIWYIKDEHCQLAVDSPGEYLFSHGIGIEKVNIYGIPEAMQESLYSQLTDTGCIKHTREGVKPDLEFASRTLDKEQAAEAVLKELGVSLEECMIIGDSSSDLDMIKKVGFGVAMGNAPDSIKTQAKAVAPRNDEDGVASMIEAYLL